LNGGPVAPTTEYIGGRRRRTSASKGAGSIFANTKRSAPLMRRIVLTVLICASLGLITVTYRGGVVISSAQLAVLEVVAPIERGMSRAWDPIAGAWYWTGDLLSATTENPKLRERNEALEAELVIARDEASEAVQLRERLGIDDRGHYPTNYDQVDGRVIARYSSAVDKSLVIDLGSNDGIERNDPVLVNANLIGRITNVTPNSARVALILENSQSVTAAISGSDGSGVLESLSTEGTPVMRLKYVDASAKVEKFDRVVTAGWTTGDLSSIYPRGIPIGWVSSVGLKPADLEQTVQVTPYANFERIETITVLVPKGDRVQYDTPAKDAGGLDALDAARRVDPVLPTPSTKTPKVTPAATTTTKDDVTQ